MLIIKRDDTEEEYDIKKIENVLKTAFTNSKTICNNNDELIKDINESIISFPNDKIYIEQVQNIIEKILVKYNYYDTVKHYIEYRNKRSIIRINEGYITKIPDDVETKWGMLGYITYKRTYARNIDNENTEEFRDTILRVLKACQKQLKINFTNDELKKAYYYLMSLKCSVAGRFLWQLGTNTVDKLGLMSLQNCAFTNIDEPIKPFLWIFDVLMLGTGVGFNIQKHNIEKIPVLINKDIVITRLDTNDADFIIPDSREGWVSFLEKILESYFYKGKSFTYSTILIRTAGAKIKGFGGTASGPEDLVKGVDNIQKILQNRKGEKLTSVDCLDIVNIIASIVVAGNVRRAALISIGDYDDIEYLKAKDWSNGNIPNWRCMSNNSVECNDIRKLPKEFWEGYNGNSEPYGLINLELSRKIGRIRDGDKYPDPTVNGYNPCLTEDTSILTNNGLVKIKDLIGKQFEAIVNGKIYKSTEKGFWLTGNKEVYKIYLANGNNIKATDNHQFKTTKGWKEVKDLTNEDYIELSDNTNFKWTGGEGNEDEGYIIGQLIGNGTFLSENRPAIDIWLNKNNQKIENYEPAIKIQKYCMTLNNRKDFKGFNFSREKNDYITYRLSCVSLNKITDKFKVFKNEKNIPENGSYEFTIGMLRGFFDSDGTVLTNIDKNRCVRLSQSNINRLKSVQKLLLSIGINSKIYYNRRLAGKRSLPDGHDGYKLYECKATHELSISCAVDLVKFQSLIGFYDKNKSDKLEYCINSYKTNYRAKPFTTKVISIKKLEKTYDVYDCTIPEVSCFSANGLIAHNCAEISLSNFETCCLGEIFLPNITSFEELKNVATVSYRICKHSLLLKCHQEETEKIVHKNSRIGIGITGFMQSTEEQKGWLSNLYEYLREYDIEYSKKIGAPISIKLTTVKPSGTLSLLTGVTPGCHPGIYQYFIRRIRIASNNKLIELCKSKGYKIEYQRNFDGTDDKNTMIIEFPCCYPEGTKLAKNMTAIDQLETVKYLQNNWSDNAVSCTIYYKLNELEEIKKWLENNYTENVKTCSFLLHNEHGFKQAPYEEISKELYEELIKKVQQITSGNINIDDEIDYSSECPNGACPIK